MAERMTELTSSSSNVYGVIDDNNNPYKNMVMDMIWMNWGYECECSIVDEEPNADVTSFFNLFKYSDEPLWNGCINHNKLLIVA